MIDSVSGILGRSNDLTWRFPAFKGVEESKQFSCNLKVTQVPMELERSRLIKFYML